MAENQLDELYKNIPRENIPWNILAPPAELVELYENKRIKPCKTIDLGCGTGNNSLWLTGKGFDVTGIDISPTAIKISEQLADKEGLKIDFFAADITKDLSKIKDTFDFAFEWEVLHHIFPEDRIRYVKNVTEKLNKHALYFSICFSEKDPGFGSSEKYRTTPIGTTLYFSSEEELEILFAPYYKIEELKTIEIRGKKEPHMAVYLLMTKK